MTNLPFTGKMKVTCEFGKKSKRWKAGYHTGIDLVGLDNITVYATHNGKIIKVDYSASYGKYVLMRDENNYVHLFAHLKSIKVKKSQRVTRATKIGIMGETGNVTGPHLHYEIRNASGQYGDVINPVAHLGIPNIPNTIINSKDYQITEKSNYQVGQQVTCSTRYPKPDSDVSEVEHLGPYKTGTIAYIQEGSKNKYLIDFGDKQAWCNDGDIRY